MSKFITFEGIDGSGKSTVAEKVVETLRSEGVDAVLTCEPTKGWLGDAVKRSYSLPIPLTEALLFQADRVAHSVEIEKWLEEGKVVISDRYSDSSFAYQGASLEEMFKESGEDSVAWLKQFERFYLKPDMTLLFVIEPEEGLKRIGNRGSQSKFEKLEYLKKVHAIYMKLAGEEDRIMKIDASRSFDEVVEEALVYVRGIIDTKE